VHSGIPLPSPVHPPSPMDGADAVEEECVEMKCAEGQSSADLGREGATAGSISSEVQFVGQVLDGGHQMEDGGVREKDGCTLETQGEQLSSGLLSLPSTLNPFRVHCN
jgi:hypothetical protein